MREIPAKTPEFGKSFEHFLVLEAFAAKHYRGRIDQLKFWRSASQLEVDLLIDDHTAVEFKSGTTSLSDAKALLALAEEMPLKNLWIVSMDSHTRKLEKNVYVLPWREYLERINAF